MRELAPATLQTGLTHEIALLECVHANADDEVKVFNLSLQRMRLSDGMPNATG